MLISPRLACLMQQATVGQHQLGLFAEKPLFPAARGLGRTEGSMRDGWRQAITDPARLPRFFFTLSPRPPPGGAVCPGSFVCSPTCVYLPFTLPVAQVPSSPQSSESPKHSASGFSVASLAV